LERHPFGAEAEKDIAESPTAEPERPKQNSEGIGKLYVKLKILNQYHFCLNEKIELFIILEKKLR
jgi:hypothetical protein